MPPTSRLPKNWPQDITFLTTSVYSKYVQSDQLRTNSASASVLPIAKAPEGSSSNIHIQPIVDDMHPANGQRGLFAAEKLKPDVFVCFYLGFIHGRIDTDNSSNYDLSLDRELQIGVDATRMGNEARFINDYRGIRDGPNAEFRDCMAEIGDGDLEKRIGVFVLTPGKKGGKRAKGIDKGEEIVVSYGKGFWSHRSMENRRAEQENPAMS